MSFLLLIVAQNVSSTVIQVWVENNMAFVFFIIPFIIELWEGASHFLAVSFIWKRYFFAGDNESWLFKAHFTYYLVLADMRNSI